MIRESMIIGTIWNLFTHDYQKVAWGPLGQKFVLMCRWFARQWRASAIVQWFCSPRFLRSGDTAEAGKLRCAARRAYQALGLSRIVSGSMFLQCFLWCAFAAAFCPLLPTMAVLGLTIVGFGATMLYDLHASPIRRKTFSLRLPVLVYAALYLIGTLTSVNLRSSLFVGVLSIVFILFSIVLYDAVETQRQLDALIAALVTVGAAVSCYGILQYLFRWGYQSQAWVDNDMFSTIQFRVSSTLQNPNMLGQYLILMIPLGGAKLLGAKDGWRRFYYLACCGVMCVCMLLTFPRGAWLALLFAGLVFFVMWKPRLLFLAPFAILALYFVLPETVVSRFTSIGNLADHSTSYRVSIWLGTIAMLRDGYWLRGIGPGEAAFNAIYPFYSYHTVVAPHSHNLYLQIICDAGIFALIAFLWLLLRYFRTLCGAIRREEEEESRLLQIAFTSGMLGFLVQAMTDYSFYNYRVMLLFWVYLAAGALSARRTRLGEGGILV